MRPTSNKPTRRKANGCVTFRSMVREILDGILRCSNRQEFSMPHKSVSLNLTQEHIRRNIGRNVGRKM